MKVFPGDMRKDQAARPYIVCTTPMPVITITPLTRMSTTLCAKQDGEAKALYGMHRKMIAITAQSIVCTIPTPKKQGHIISRLTEMNTMPFAESAGKAKEKPSTLDKDA